MRVGVYIVSFWSWLALTRPAMANEIVDNTTLIVLSLVSGFLFAVMGMIVFRRPLRRISSQLLKRLGRPAPHMLPRASLAERVYGYYIWDRESGEEYFSPTCRGLFQIDDTVMEFEGLKRALSADHYDELCLAFDQVKAGDADSVPLYVNAIGSNKKLECILVLCDGHDENCGVTMWVRDVSSELAESRQLHKENEALIAKVNKLQMVLDNAPFPIWQRGRDLGIYYCNHAYADLLDSSPQQQAIGTTVPELDQRVYDVARKARESGHVEEEKLHVVAGGKRTLYKIIEQPFVQEQEHQADVITGYAFSLRAQAALEAELKRYISAQSDLLESSTSAMAIYGPDMRLKSYNQSFVSLWKLDEGWLDSEPTYGDVLEQLREKRLLPEQANFPAFKKQNVDFFTQLINTYEEFYYLPNNKVVRVIVIPHALGGLLFAYEDVTDRIMLEREFNTLIAVQRATLDHLHEGIAVFGEDGCIKLFNPEYAALWDFDPEWLGTNPNMFELLEKAKPLIDTTMNETQLREWVTQKVITRSTNEMHIERTDGKVLYSRSVPLPDGGTLIAYYDVTDSTLLEESLREKNQALEESDRVKKEFLATMSYELRSPLTSIIGFAQVMSAEYTGPLNDKQHEYVDDILDASNKLMTLVNDILDLASISAGYMKLQLEELDVEELLYAAVQMIEAVAEESAVTITVQCPNDIGAIEVDGSRLKQVLFNLLHNAIKFTPASGNITVGARRESGTERVALWVEDSGVGIARDQQEHVFKRFYKAGSSRMHKSGTGLGLSMVKRFTELHGGAVELQSDEDKGTIVTCYYPIKANIPTVDKGDDMPVQVPHVEDVV